MRTDVSRITESSPHTELTEGLKIFAGGTSKLFYTGEWRTKAPYFNEKKCNNCLLCAPVCPDSCIPVSNGKRSEFNFDYCKGCGICAKACPAGAIEMKEGE